MLDLFHRHACGPDAAEANRKRQGVRLGIALAKHEHDVPCLAGLEIDTNLECRARVETSAESLPQGLTRQRCGSSQRSIPSQEFEPVSG